MEFLVSIIKILTLVIFNNSNGPRELG